MKYSFLTMAVIVAVAMIGAVAHAQFDVDISGDGGTIDTGDQNVDFDGSGVDVEGDSSGDIDIDSGGVDVFQDSEQQQVDIDAGGVDVNQNDAGSQVDISADGAVDANLDAVDVQIQGRNTINTSPGTVDIETSSGAVNINVTPGSVDVSVGGESKTMNIEAGRDGIRIRSADGRVDIRSNNGSLSAQLRSGTLNADERAVVATLDAGSRTLIQSDNDLRAYGAVLAETSPSVRGVSVEPNRVRVQYRQRARLLGFLPANLGADVVVNADGSVQVDLPWYAFLFSADTSTVEASVQGRLIAAQNSGIVTISAIGSGDVVRVQNSAQTANIVASGVEESATISGDGGSVNVDGDGGVQIQPN